MMSMNALTRSKLEDVAMNWDTFRKIDHTYSDVIKNEMKQVTNQKSSGRSGFAALNLMRIDLAKKYNLGILNFLKVISCFLINLKKQIIFLKIF